MDKSYYITTQEGTEIIDNSPHAQRRIISMDFLEKRYARRLKRKEKGKLKKSRNPLYRLAAICGIL